MTCSLSAARGADLAFAYAFPAQMDVSSYTARMVIYASRGGAVLLEFTEVLTANGSFVQFDGQRLEVHIEAADIDALPVNADPTSPALLQYDVFLTSVDLTQKLTGGLFKVMPVGSAACGCDGDLTVALGDCTTTVELVGARGANGVTVPVSAFMETALDDSSAPAARTTLGAADRGLTEVTASTFGSKTFSVSGQTTDLSLADISRYRVNIKAFGAKGDNVTDDTAAINAAIAYANSLTFPVEIYSPPGQYLITGALTPITKSCIVAGDGVRVAIWVFSGNYDCITFHNPATRLPNVGIRGMGFYCSGMTGGTFLTVDWTQDALFQNVFVFSPYNFALVRQSGGCTFDLFDVQPIRGAYGLKWYGTGATRGGEVDKCDVLDLRSCILGGNLVPGVSAGTCDLIWMDGYVQTLNFSRLILINSKRAIYTSNTPGLPYPKIPSFLLGNDLEIENTTQEGINAEVLNTMNVSGFFCAGSTSEFGVLFGSNASQITITGGRINSHWKGGMRIAGACNVTLTGLSVFDNSEFTAGGFSGVEIDSGTTIAFVGGTYGKPAGAGAYTENQKYGVKNTSGLRVTAVGVDFSDNQFDVAHGTTGTITTAACIAV